MSRLIGIDVGFHKDQPAEEGLPSSVEVQFMWNRIIMDADLVEKLLAHISTRLKIMKKWEYLGMVKRDELENAEDWHEIRNNLLYWLMLHRSEGAFLEEVYSEGAGI